MDVTPSAKSAGLAGFGIGLLLWTFVFKINTFARLFRVQSFVKRDKVLDWIGDNSSLFLAGTAATNLAVHGLSPLVVPMTLTMEMVNIFMVMLLKVRRLFTRRHEFI